MNTDQESISQNSLATDKYCQNCGALLYVYRIKLFGVTKHFPIACKCRINALEQIKLNEISTQKRRRLDRLFKQSNLGERFKNSSFDDFKISEESEFIFNKIKKYTFNFSENKTKSIILYGKPGTGKTLLVSSVINKLISEGIPSVFQVVPDLLMLIRSSFNNPNFTEEELMNGLKSCELLVLDDIGAERHKSQDDWPTERLFQIINNRYINSKATLFTTNCSLEELYNKLGARTFSRIVEMTEGYKFDMNKLSDWRIKNYI